MLGNCNYGNFREWMYKRFDEVTEKISAEFKAEVQQFMIFSYSHPIVRANGGEFLCPCSVCKKDKHISGRRESFDHLLSQYGFRNELH